MLWLAILVGLSPTLAFKGLTLTTLFTWFNVHPFWFMFTLGVLFSKGKDENILDKISNRLDKIIERR